MSENRDDLLSENAALRAELAGLKSASGDLAPSESSPALHLSILNRLRSVLEAADELLGLSDWDQFCRRAVELPREELGIERVALVLVELGANTVRHTFGTNLQGRTTDERQFTSPKPAWVVEVVRDLSLGRARWRFVEQSPLTEEGAKESGQGWTAASPVHAGGKLLGMLFNDRALSKRAPDAVTQEFVLLYGSLLGNIIRRRQAQESEQKAAEGLRATLASADELIGITDRDLFFKRAVELARERLGLERVGLSILADDGEHIRPTFGTDLQGHTVDERGDSLPLDDAWRKLKERMAAGQPRWVHLPDYPAGYCKDSQRVQLVRSWLVMTPIYVEGRLIGALSNDAAITQRPLDETKQELVAVYCSLLGNMLRRRSAEEALWNTEHRHRQRYNQAPVMMHTLDREGRLVMVNDYWLSALGYTREEVLGRRLREFLTAESRHRMEDPAMTDLSRTEESRGIELRIFRKNGHVMDVLLSESIERNAEGKRVRSLAVLTDITERKRMEEHFRQVQKIEAVGKLAGGVAHDFNNLLMVILGHADFLLERLDRNDKTRESAAEIKTTGERAAALTRQLLAFSRQQMLRPETLDINQVVTDVHKLLHRLIGEDISVLLSLETNIKPILADRSQIEQVLMNLAVNARDAMPQGGKLIIETAVVELDDSYASTHPVVVPGHFVRLCISDTGSGMTPEVKERIFEPFYTTKEQGKGTGLGLATVYGVVKQSGGFIWVYSEPGIGTTFKIYLPVVTSPSATTSGRPLTEKPSPGGNETVLLVEDESGVRDLIRQILVLQGYQVLEASDAETALRISQQHKEQIQLLITDVIMPGMGGREMAEQLAKQHPEVKVLFISGYTDEAVTPQGILEKGRAFLQKPFNRQSLLQKVREVLEQTPL